MLKSVILVLVVMILAPFNTVAFAPSRFCGIHSGHDSILRHGKTDRKSTHCLQMGIFDFFSEEAKQARKEAEEARKREEEEAFREMMERRRNPEKMEEYEAEVAVRREKFKRMKTKLEQQQEDFYIDENK